MNNFITLEHKNEITTIISILKKYNIQNTNDNKIFSIGVIWVDDVITTTLKNYITYVPNTPILTFTLYKAIILPDEIFSIINKFENLLFNGEFNQPLTNLPNIKYLCLGSEYNESLDNIPITLKTLIIKNKDYNKSINYLPHGLENLIIKSNLDCTNLPTTLKNLALLDIEEIHIDFNNLPDGLENIFISSYSKLKIEPLINIPSRLKQIMILECFSFIDEIIEKLINAKLINKKTIDLLYFEDYTKSTIDIIKQKYSF